MSWWPWGKKARERKSLEEARETKHKAPDENPVGIDDETKAMAQRLIREMRWPKGRQETAAQQLWKPNIALHQTGTWNSSTKTPDLVKTVQTLHDELLIQSKALADATTAFAKREVEHHDLLKLVHEAGTQLLQVNTLLIEQDKTIGHLQNEIDALKAGVVLD